MKADIIDGKAEAELVRNEVAIDALSFKEQFGIAPGLKVVIVGDNPASRAYVRTKTKMAAQANISGELIEMPDDTTTEQLLSVVEKLNQDPATHGILVQLPLPAHIDEPLVLDAIKPEKDVDGFHPLNVGRLFSAQKSMPDDLLIPCTPYGCLRMIKNACGSEGTSGRHAAIIGRSNIVGKPMAALLLSADCTVTVTHSRTKDLAGTCSKADILVAAVGRPLMVKKDWVKPGAIVIDVGINRIETENGGKGRIVGDVDFDDVAPVAGAITPVPGGVGPMTVACLLRNTLVAARNIAGQT